MGLKIRIPKHIWDDYQLPDVLVKSHSGSSRTGPKITIPAHIWNDYQPDPPIPILPTPSTTPSAPAPKLALNLRRPPAHPALAHHVVRERKRKDTTSCNIKPFRFHHGGPRRQQKGKWQNRITYEKPCLRVTCGSCWVWHRDAVWEGMVGRSVEGVVNGRALVDDVETVASHGGHDRFASRQGHGGADEALDKRGEEEVWGGCWGARVEGRQEGIGLVECEEE